MQINKSLTKSAIYILSAIFLLSTAKSINAQDKEYKIGCAAFYNLENIFDTIDQPEVSEYDFAPGGSNNWNSKKYWEKLGRMAKVISEIGSEYVPGGPALMGVSEIENITVLQDLIEQKPLAKSGYKIAHFDSPDKRGIDVALLYRSQSFKVTNKKAVPLHMPDIEDFYTRDILVVSGEFDGEKMHVLVNHWPSRRGGEKRSAPLRNAAAKLARSIVDSLLNEDKNAKIIVMGDLNDNPTNESVETYLKAKGKQKKLKKGDLFNPMAEYFKKGIGTTAYKDVWSLFDQLIISQGLLGKDKSTYKFYAAKIFKKDYLIQQEGRFKGYPFRTYAGGAYLGGYSDHFPVYMFLIKEK